ncbi:NAD(P)-dependent alcohol dehydrogenase [Mycolicibacterium sp. P9-64]|uniref:NAD(P)-dependent alcohol dehydrogenase n=1 Tax=Mycolicibacterium sp. P9-64 TaxID=2024612 RepID=UPI0011EC4288|nr:NAD(P)-dependent alcohol dehydrogenase [Mycolicibacterium sp. P9-64]KAA0079487.1 NAD(P)-dependent alcohol dehydrogenase [Mycolicibacterium sp. P9-64]
MKTIAAVLVGANQPLELQEVEIAGPRADEVLVRMVGSGICHTDLGVVHEPAPGQTPIVLGHEGAGVVEEVGTAVTRLTVGDHVVMSYAHCAECDHCRSGIPQHCRQFVPRNLVGTRVDGSSPLSRGTQPVRGSWFGQSSWAKHAVVEEQNAVKVESALPLALLGPLGCGIQTGAGAVLNTLAPPTGSSIVVFGVGSVGLAAVLAAVVAGCSTIVAVDISDTRLQKAAELGATHTVNSARRDPVTAVKDATHGRGAQFSVECIGRPAVVRAALECLQTPGVCATVGFQGPSNDIVIDQGHLLFGRALVGVIEGDAVPGNFIPRMVELHDQGRFPFESLIQAFPFTEINAAVDAARTGAVVKAVVTFADEQDQT